MVGRNLRCGGGPARPRTGGVELGDGQEQEEGLGIEAGHGAAGAAGLVEQAGEGLEEAVAHGGIGSSRITSGPWSWARRTPLSADPASRTSWP
jgi:hypothetical protein